MSKVQGPRSFLVSALLAAASSLAAATDDVRFGVLPLYFEANHGQADERVQFFARGREHTVYLTAGGASIALKQGETVGRDLRARRQPSERSKAARPEVAPYQAVFGEALNERRKNAVVRFVHLKLVGANTNFVPTAQEKLPGRINYLFGKDPSHWQQDVTTFARVRYTRVYPGVDLVYYGNEQELEYDFIVAPDADASVITLRFDGADRIEIDELGDLLLHVADSQLRQHKPVAYQTIAGARRPVSARYEIKDRQTVAFSLGRYDRAHELVIDPILSYSTYLGGSRDDIGWSIAVDANGSAYVAGDTLSVFKKLPVSGLQTTNGGGTKYGGDAFITRLDFNGTNLSLGYLTYLGGSGLDAGIGIAVDGAGDAYVTGYTTSTNFPVFPVPGVLQTNISGDSVLSVFKGDIVGSFNSPYTDAFVTKLDTNGLGVYSTYLGGELSESGVDIAVDGAGAAYIVGYTESALTFLISNRVETARCTNNICGTPIVTTNITTAPLLIASSTVTNDLGFLKSSTNTLQSVVTTTLLSPMSSAPFYTGFPIANAIQTNNGSLAFFEAIRTKRGDRRFVEPGTNVLNSVVTPADLFVSKLASDGSALIYSTYLGGFLDDFGTGVAVDAAGNAIVSGWTDSFDFPVMSAIQPDSGGGRDAVLAKLDASGGALVFSTYLGGLRNDAGYRVAVDAADNAYLTGATGSSDFPSTPGALNRGGVFLNTGSGTNSWTNNSSGLTHATVQAFAADPMAPGTYYAGTPRGVFKTIDDGLTWTASSTGLLNRAVNTLALDPFQPNTIYAGTAGGIYLSTDGGSSWTNYSTGLTSLDVRTLLFNPATTNLYAGTTRGAFQRPLGATNWSLLGTGLQSRRITTLALHPAALSDLYAGTSTGIFKSTNSGATWKSSSKGLKTTSMLTLVIAPDDATLLYAGTTRGIYKSTDAAMNWSIRTNIVSYPPIGPKIQINTLLVDPTLPSTVYAGATFGIFKSFDSGETWSLTQTNLTNRFTRDVATLAFSPASTATLYAGTRVTTSAGGTNDAFLVKLAPDGLSLPYAFTFGGSRNDEAWDVAVDAAGYATVVGQTASKNFPIAGFTTNSPAYQTNLSGKIDAFISKFDPTGATNLFTMYFGGKRNDFGHSIALDPSGDAYIVGRTESSNLGRNKPARFPITNALNTVSSGPLDFSGGRDAFVAKLLTGAPFMSARFAAASDQFIVSWPASSPEFILECREPSATAWMPVTQSPIVVDGRRQVALPASAATCFFRLRLSQ